MTNNRQEEGRVCQSNNQENKLDPVACTEYASQVRWQDIAMNGVTLLAIKNHVNEKKLCISSGLVIHVVTY